MTTLKNLADWHHACRHKSNKVETITGPGGTVTLNHFEAEQLCRQMDQQLNRMRGLLHRAARGEDDPNLLAEEILRVLNED